MYAVISDTHANLEATEAVLEDIFDKGIKEIYCLGDIVGYGPNPDENCNLIRKYCKTVIGNHDADVVHLFFRELREAGSSFKNWFRQKRNPVDTSRTFGRLLRGCTHPWAYNVILRHRHMLQDKNKRWLANLPLEIEEKNVSFRHDSPGTELYDFKRKTKKQELADFAGYILHPRDYFDEDSETTNIDGIEKSFLKEKHQGSAYYALFTMQKREIGIAIMGHNHVACYISQQKEGRIKRGDKHVVMIKHNMRKKPALNTKEAYELVLNPDFMYLLNPGAVGQPRDRDPRASYLVVYDNTVVWHKIPYPVKKTIEKINEMDIMHAFGSRLCSGI